MSDILCYLPTYSPTTEAIAPSRPYTRESNADIAKRLRRQSRVKPAVYFDAIDSILNNPTPVRLVVADGRSTESMRAELAKHHREARVEALEAQWHGHPDPGRYELMLYDGRESQWKLFNDVYATAGLETEYFVYTSSDVVWTMDWVREAIKAFEADPKVQILFPCVNRGDPNLPCQIAAGPRDLDLVEPPFQRAARAPVLNAYAMIFRMSFLKEYGGYPTVWKNCFTESFLHYMAEAAGGKMRLMPRGHVYHFSALDAWNGDGGWYGYNGEKASFDKIMDEVLAKRAKGEMTVSFLKEILMCGNR